MVFIYVKICDVELRLNHKINKFIYYSLWLDLLRIIRDPERDPEHDPEYIFHITLHICSLLIRISCYN
jgi:hypothetical protein